MKAKHYCNILAKFATSIILITVIILILEITTFRNVDVTFAYPPPQSELGKSTDPNPYPAQKQIKLLSQMKFLRTLLH